MEEKKIGYKEKREMIAGYKERGVRSRGEGKHEWMMDRREWMVRRRSGRN